MERLEPRRSSVIFHSASGPLTVIKAGGGYVMNFPARFSEPISVPPDLTEALGIVPLEVFANAFNYMVLLESASVVRTLSPDLAVIARLDRSGVIVTAPGEAKYDFVSRYFAPAKGISEAGSTARSAPRARPTRPESAWPGRRWPDARLSLSTPRPAGRQP